MSQCPVWVDLTGLSLTSYWVLVFIMKFYMLRGKDDSSDTGHWEVIVTAVNIDQANILIAQHLMLKGRMDLTQAGGEIVEIKPDGHAVIYSTVEEK